MSCIAPMRLSPLLAVILLLLAGCGGGSGDGPGETTAAPATVCGTDGRVSLPANFPEPEIPCDNRLNAAKIELGRFLFYDRNLSFNQTQSCADCHQQDRAFSDGLTTSVGSTGSPHPRNAMSLTNVVYNATQNWANDQLTTLDQQSLSVLLNEEPVELGWTGHEEEIIDRFRSPLNDPAAGLVDYPALFAAAFPDKADPYTVFSFTQALGAFVSTLISGDSEFDREQRGEANSMSDAAKRGRELFFSERLECFHCHGGFNFSDSVDHTGVVFDQAAFHNTGLYNLDTDADGIGDGAFPANNKGIREFTLLPEDEGKFRAPTLRNIALTAPYMHDGSIATLDEVLDHYARGGRLIAAGPYAGDGALNPNKSSLIAGFVLTPDERLDVIAFLESLTDMAFICNADLSDPFGNLPPHPLCP